MARGHALALGKAAFNYQTELKAERGRAVLEQSLLAPLKDEDEVIKKWIAMIG
jgi:hypothetical protein